MTAGDKSSWNWHDEGFKLEPKCVLLRWPMTVYRVWGGTSTEMGDSRRPGVCLSFEQPKSRKESERLFSLWEWGNTCRSVSPFRIEPGAKVFVGSVHPGDFYDHGLGSPASQVFVERNQFDRFVHKIGAARELLDDLAPYHVVPNREPGRARSS
jgi:hypothetical protein